MSSAQQRVLNKKLSQIFRMRGLSLRPDAMQPLYDCLETDENWESTLQALLAAVQAGPLKDNAVDGASVRRALGQLETRSSCATELPLEVVDADAMTPLKFVTARKQFLPTAPGSLHGPAESKQTMFALRLQLLEQRLKRNVLFKPPALSHGVNQKEHIQLTHIDALLGRKGPRVVLGLLTEMEEGRFHLEDAHSAIPLDLSQAETHKGLFTRNSVVVMEGEVQPSGAFLVSTVGLPPHESRAESIAALAGLDLLHPPLGSYAFFAAVQGFDHPKYGTLLQPPPAREPAQRQQRSSNAHRAHRPLCAGRSALPWAAGGGGPRGGAEGLPATHCDGRAQVRAQEELGVGGVGVWGEKILGLCKLETIFENQTKTKCFKFSQPLRTYTSAPPPTDVCLSHTSSKRALPHGS